LYRFAATVFNYLTNTKYCAIIDTKLAMCNLQKMTEHMEHSEHLERVKHLEHVEQPNSFICYNLGRPTRLEQ